MLLCCGAGCWCALFAAPPLSAQIRIVPRAKLDSLAHPATAAGGAEAMRFERTLIDAGHIGEDDVPPVYTFRWRKTGGKPSGRPTRTDHLRLRRSELGQKRPSHRAAKAP